MIKYFGCWKGQGENNTDSYSIFLGKILPGEKAEDFPAELFSDLKDNKIIKRVSDPTQPFTLKECHCDEGPAVISFDDKGNERSDAYIYVVDGVCIGQNLGIFSKEDMQNYLVLI